MCLGKSFFIYECVYDMNFLRVEGWGYVVISFSICEKYLNWDILEWFVWVSIFIRMCLYVFIDIYIYRIYREWWKYDLFGEILLYKDIDVCV